MHIAIVGGGPGGLYVAISLKLRDATHSVSLFERNQPDDTLRLGGWCFPKTHCPT